MPGSGRVALQLLLFVAAVVSQQVQRERAALIIVDVQNCFLPGGSLAVNEGGKVIPVIKRLRSEYRKRWSLVVMTQDWHCADHVSFASQHSGFRVHDIRNLSYSQTGKLCDVDGMKNKYAVNCKSVAFKVEQTLWPDHCVKNTTGAEFSAALSTNDTDLVVRKGYHCQVDSYSGFFDNGKFDHTELHEKLQGANITTIFVVGLAMDYCVCFTALHGVELGYKTYVVVDATGVMAKGTSEAAIARMKDKGVHMITSDDIDSTLPGSGSPTLTTKALTLFQCFIITYFISI